MLVIEPYTGDRSLIRELFEQADDSSSEIDSYIKAGDVLVARFDGAIVGHVQLVTFESGCEIKSIATLESVRRQGIGTALVNAVLEHAVARGCTRVVVGTATADLDNLRFYQRQGFQMDRIEPNAFTADRGYPALEANGIQVRDRAWLSIDLGRRN